jgi:hypothetical protein
MFWDLVVKRSSLCMEKQLFLPVATLGVYFSTYSDLRYHCRDQCHNKLTLSKMTNKATSQQSSSSLAILRFTLLTNVV